MHLLPAFVVLLHTSAAVSASSDGVPQSCSALYAEQVQRWREKVEMRRATNFDAYLAEQRWWNGSKTYDLYEPEWDCAMQDRIGEPYGDGGKFVCGGLELLRGGKNGDGSTGGDPALPCLVYSVGVNSSIAFERDILAGTDCEVHSFDPTVEEAIVDGMASQRLAHASHRSRFSFHMSALNDKSTANYSAMGRPGAPLLELMQGLGHSGRRISLLKVDCEGCETRAFRDLFLACEAGVPLPVDQLLVELHGTQHEPIDEFFRGADACGLRLFHKERNGWGCQGYKCAEFSFIGEAAAKRAFVRSHCPWDEF